MAKRTISNKKVLRAICVAFNVSEDNIPEEIENYFKNRKAA